jgi:hypothetical protein
MDTRMRLVDLRMTGDGSNTLNRKSDIKFLISASDM